MTNNASRTKRNSKLYDKPPKKPQKPRGKKGRRKRHILIRLLGWFLALIMIVLLIGAVTFFSYASDAPRITEADLASENSTQILDNQKNVIWTMAAQPRSYAQSNEIPDTLKNAVVGIEDRRFYKHSGVDPIRIMGAAAANVRGSSLGMQGGSTLTQQLVKLSVFSTSTADQNMKRKCQEAWLALSVEKSFSKDQILTFYINKVYMGHGVYGMKTASEYFYNKPLNELSLAQTALLAGMPQSPRDYDPYLQDTTAAKERRHLVLQGMVAMGDVTQADADKADATPVNDGLQNLDSKAASADANRKVVDAYVSSTLNEVKDLGYDTNKAGLKIYTNLDSKIQRKMYDTANGHDVPYPTDDVQVGATMMDPNNGQVVGQIGGRNLKTTFGLNRATQGSRSSGSSIKPLLDYAPAVEYLDWPTYRTIADKPYKYAGSEVSLNNWDNKFMGNITMRTALTQSRNIPAVEALDSVGGADAQKFLKKIGIPTSEKPTGTAAIGIEVSSEQEAAAFSTLSNGGTYYKPSYVQKVVTADGTTHNYAPKGKEAMKSSTAFMVTDMLKGVIKDNATASKAIIPGLHQAGKTGLVAYDESVGMPSQAISDAWFTGYTRAYALSVWTGYDQPNEPGHYIPWEAQDLPQNYYKDVMTFAMADKQNNDWEAPHTVVPVVRGGIVEYQVKDATWNTDGLPDTISVPQSGSPAN